MIYWFIYEEDYNLLPLSLIPQAFMAVCIVIMMLQEKLVLKREKKLLLSDNTKEWDYALEKYESNSYRNIRADSMKKDLKKIYRIRLSAVCFLFGLFAFAYPVFNYVRQKTSRDNEYLNTASATENIFAFFLTIFGTLCILTSVYQFLGLPVYLFLRKNHENTEAIDRSYMEGKMICGKLNGLNVGFEYCIYYDLFGVDCINVRNIEYAEAIKKIKKEKSTSGFYHKVKQDISLKLTVKDRKFPYSIDLNELQLDNICDELMRRGVKIIKK